MKFLNLTCSKLNREYTGFGSIQKNGRGDKIFSGDKGLIIFAACLARRLENAQLFDSSRR